MKAAAYLRVSTEEQAMQGFSIEAQRRVLDGYCAAFDIQITEYYTDEGYSAKNMRRPAMQSLIKDCKAKKFDRVIVWRLDRLSRNLRDTLEFVEDIIRKNGLELISTTERIDTDTSSGRMMINFIASIAQNEREVNAERVTMVSRELAKQCHHMGGLPPFGYRVENKKYIVDQDQSRAVLTIFNMFADGKGYDTILAWLIENGFTTPRGNAFKKTTLYELLGNEKYRGIYTYNRTISADRNGKRNNRKSKLVDEIIRVEDGMPRIIDERLWQAVQALRERNKKEQGAYTAREPYLLSGIVFCGKCGTKMTGVRSGKDRDGTTQRYYACGKCNRRLRKEKAELAVIQRVKELIADSTAIRFAVTIANQYIENERSDAEENEREVRKQIRELEKKTKGIVDFIAQNGAAAPAQLTDELRQLGKKKDTLLKEIERIRFVSARELIDPEDAIEQFRVFNDIDNKPMDMKKTIVQKQIGTVRIYDDYIAFADSAVCGGGEGN